MKWDLKVKNWGMTVVARITVERVHRFYWRNIIRQFDVPGVIVPDNGTQFTGYSVVEFYKELGIRNRFISVEHPQVNGQVEAANKIILSGMNKKLDKAKGLWAIYLHEIL